LYGVYQYLTTVGLVGASASHPPIAGVPMWVSAAFAVSVFAGTLGSLCLLMLNRSATALLVLSLLSDVLWDIRTFSGGDRVSSIGIVATATIVAIFLAWISYFAGKRGWLR
jgi:hypothetical protein